MNTSQALARCHDHMVINPKVRKATVYLNDKLVVSLCRRHKASKRFNDFVVKVGVPNYLERDFIKDCKTAGVSLPLHSAQLAFWPKKRKSKKAHAA